jgi:hypothetical protein
MMRYIVRYGALPVRRARRSSIQVKCQQRRQSTRLAPQKKTQTLIVVQAFRRNEDGDAVAAIEATSPAEPALPNVILG